MKRCILGLLLGVSAWLLASTTHAQESMERGLLRQAPKLIRFFKEQGYKNIGVLKFLVSREGENKFSDNVGTLNLLAARRLELSLTLTNDPRTPLGIISNASNVARDIPGATHLSKAGREKLFTGQYPLAWGNERVQADAFVTGTVLISKDLRRLTLALYTFDRTTNRLTPFGEDFQVANSTARLAEMGESFALRGIADNGFVEPAENKSPAKVQEAAYTAAVKVHDQYTQHPAHPSQYAQQPVTLEVLYDGRVVPYQIENGKAFIQEPQQGQAVAFRLTRDRSKERYGVVLKVNGENTLDKQRVPDLSCRKWILDPPPAKGPWTIEGFQIGDNHRERFRVASIQESAQRGMNYGADVGTITMTVFRDQKAKVRPGILDDDAQYQTVVTKLTEMPKGADNYYALKAQLLDDANRGLIVDGEREANSIRRVTFNADPNPVMVLTIVYRRK